MISLFLGFLKLLLRINDDMDTMETKKSELTRYFICFVNGITQTDVIKNIDYTGNHIAWIRFSLKLVFF